MTEIVETKMSKSTVATIQQIKEKYQITTANVLPGFGEEKVVSYSPIAGKSAQTSGSQLEKITFDIMRKNVNITSITKRPKFQDHFELEDREGDFGITYKGDFVHVECKQLGKCESHFDKLSHVFMNLINRCYGTHFWLVYEYNKEGGKSTLKKIDALEKRCRVIKEQVALQGITFEYLTIEKLIEFGED